MIIVFVCFTSHQKNYRYIIMENPIILKACANQVTRQDHVNKEYELYLMNLMTKTMITLKYKHREQKHPND